MRRIVALGFVFFILMAVPSTSEQAPLAAEVLERSITYHDPHGLWNQSRFHFEIRETRPDGGERRTRVQFDLSKNAFEILTHRDGAVIEGLIADDDCVVTLNGSLEFSDEEREKYRLTCERIAWMRDYYTYLWGLPMKLRDPGTRVDAPAAAAEFQEQPVWSIRVTYDEAVGSDTWYFYFDQETYALAGYRFYHNEADNDGEYILLEGEIESDGLKVPARRSWYTHAEDRYLGDDILVEIGVSPR